MKTITHRIAAVALLLIGLLAVPSVSRAQTVMNTLTNSAAITTTGPLTFVVSSVTNVVVGSELFVPDTGEIMCVTAVNTTAVSVTVRRGCEGTGAFTGLVPVTTTIIIIPPNASTGSTGDYDMGGACTRGQGYAAFSPYINKKNGYMWVCISSTWRGATRKTVTLNSLPPFTP